MKTPTRIILSILTIGLALAVQAKVESTDRDLLPTRRQNILNRITSPEVGAKDAIKKTDALVCIMLSPGWLDIIAVTPDRSRAKDLAEAIDNQLTEIKGVKTEYGTSGIYGVADVTKNNARWFQKHAELTVPAGRILQNLKDKGFTPQVVLRIPKARGMSFEPDFETTVKSWRYRLMKDDETELAFKASSDVTPLIILGTVTMCAGFLIVGAIGIVVAHLIAKRESIEIKVRRNLYYKIVMGSTFGSIALHMPFFMWFYTTGYSKVLADSWIGTLSVSPFMTAIMLPMLLLPLATKWLTKREKVLFGTGPAEVAAVIEQVERAEKARQRKLLLYIGLPMMIVVPVAFYIAYQSGSPRPIITVALTLMLFGFVGMSLLDTYLKKKDNTSTMPEAANKVDALVQEVAQSMGVTVKKLVVDSAQMMAVCVQATVSPFGVLTLSKGAVDKLTEDELRAIIAHECGHLKAKHLRMRIGFLAAGIVLMILTMATIPLGSRFFGRTTIMPALMVYFVLSLALLPIRLKVTQKQESEADRLGLEATRNYLAIESAFQKMVANSPMPGVHDLDIRSHPSMGKRLKALREHAMSLGLRTEPELEEVGSFPMS